MAATALSLAGCAASGVQVTEEQAQSFQPGKATYADVVAALGPPTVTTTQSNGNRIAVYSYAAVQSRPQNFIPYIGPLERFSVDVNRNSKGVPKGAQIRFGLL